MRKKGLLLIVLALFLFVLTGCQKPAESSGEVTVIIVDQDEEELFNGVLEFNEKDSLVDILKNHEEIAMKGQESSLGFMVTELMGVNSEDYEFVFWRIQVNGEDSLVGVSQIPLHDGDEIRFDLIAYLL